MPVTFTEHLESIENQTIWKFEDLDLDDIQIVQLAQAIKNNKNLEQIEFKNVAIPENKIFANILGSLSENVKILKIQYCSMMEDDIHGLLKASTFKNLSELDLEGNDIGDAARLLAASLGNNTTLTTLNLAKNNIGDGSINLISTLLEVNETLSKINLAANNITKNGLKSLNEAHQDNENLKIIIEREESVENILNDIIYDEQITEKLLFAFHNNKANVIALAHKKGLEEDLKEKIDIKFASMNKSNRELTDKLQQLNNNTIEALDLKNYTLNNDNIKALSQALKNNISLKAIILDSNRLQFLNSNIGTLMQSIEDHPNIQALTITNNNIDAGEAEYIAAMISKNKKLHNLDLSYNELGDRGAEIIVGALKNNNNIQKINLESNSISNENILISLLENDKLEELNINSNNINNEGAVKILEMVESRKNIRIQFANNDIEDEDLQQQIENLAQSNSESQSELVPSPGSSAGVPHAAEGQKATGDDEKNSSPQIQDNSIEIIKKIDEPGILKQNIGNPSAEVKKRVEEIEEILQQNAALDAGNNKTDANPISEKDLEILISEVNKASKNIVKNKITEDEFAGQIVGNECIKKILDNFTDKTSPSKEIAEKAFKDMFKETYKEIQDANKRKRGFAGFVEAIGNFFDKIISFIKGSKTTQAKKIYDVIEKVRPKIQAIIIGKDNELNIPPSVSKGEFRKDRKSTIRTSVERNSRGK